MFDPWQLQIFLYFFGCENSCSLTLVTANAFTLFEVSNSLQYCSYNYKLLDTSCNIRPDYYTLFYF